MKTADLIPLLLIELNESDKYGFELTKNIETKSNGKIIIKQPTLYTLLKKLEKSKFISSYWQDSDIGGKRHYYTITENGKLQLSTLPSYDVLIKNICTETEPVDETEALTSTSDDSDEATYIKPTPVETILPSTDVFNADSIDVKTNSEINADNVNLIKSDNKAKEDQFVSNENVAKFVEAQPVATPPIKNVETNTNQNFEEILNLDIDMKPTSSEIKYSDYVNLKTSKEYQKSKTFSKLTVGKSILVSLFIVFILASSIFITKKTGTSVLYYVCLILGLNIAIFYPIFTALYIDTISSKFKQNNYKLNLKMSLFPKLFILCMVIICVLVININLGYNTFVKMFSFYNYANFYVPILISASMILDTILAYFISHKITK